MSEALATLNSVVDLLDEDQQTLEALWVALRALTLADSRWVGPLNAAHLECMARYPDSRDVGVARRWTQAGLSEKRAYREYLSVVENVLSRVRLSEAVVPNEPTLRVWLDPLRHRAPMLLGAWSVPRMRVFVACFWLGLEGVGVDTSADRRLVALVESRLRKRTMKDDRWDLLLLDLAGDGVEGVRLFVDEMERVVVTSPSS